MRKQRIVNLQRLLPGATKLHTKIGEVNMADSILSWQGMGRSSWHMTISAHFPFVARLADAGANSADDGTTVHRLIDLTWAAEPGATDGRARFEAFVRGRLATLVVGWHGDATQLPYAVILVSYFPILARGLMIAQVCDHGMLAMWGYRVPDDLSAWGLRWVLFSVELWGGANPIAAVCAQRAIVRCVVACRSCSWACHSKSGSASCTSCAS